MSLVSPGAEHSVRSHDQHQSISGRALRRTFVYPIRVASLSQTRRVSQVSVKLCDLTHHFYTVLQAKMKRSNSQLLTPERRKSARIAEQTRRPPLREQYLETYDESYACNPSRGNNEYSLLQWSNAICEEYNRFVPFAKDCASASTFNGPSSHSTAVARTVQEIDKIVKDARQQVLEKVVGLDAQVHQFKLATSMVPEAYEGGDLLGASF